MMNFELTEEQQSVQKMVRKFVDKEIIPVHSRVGPQWGIPTLLS